MSRTAMEREKRMEEEWQPSSSERSHDPQSEIPEKREMSGRGDYPLERLTVTDKLRMETENSSSRTDSLITLYTNGRGTVMRWTGTIHSFPYRTPWEWEGESIQRITHCRVTLHSASDSLRFLCSLNSLDDESIRSGEKSNGVLVLVVTLRTTEENGISSLPLGDTVAIFDWDSDASTVFWKQENRERRER